MMRSSRSFASAGAGVVFVLAAATAGLAAPKGPPYFDPQRSIQKQEEAAKAAVAETTGGKDLAKTMTHLASVSAYVRDAVFLDMLKSYGDDKLLELAGQALASPDPFVAGTVAEALGTKKLAAARPILEKALAKQKDPEVLGELCWALGELADAESAEVLAKLAKKDKGPFQVTGEAFQALARCDPSKAKDVLKEGLGSKLAGVKIACLADLARVDEATGIEAALAALDDKAQKGWEARVLIQCLENFWSPPKREPHKEALTRAIDKLIPRLKTEDGRPRHEIGKTLRSLTDQWDMGDDFESWSGWWSVQRDKWKPADLDRKKMREEEAASGGTVLRYHGIPIYSKRLTFLLDLSGGMSRPLGGDGTDTPQRLLFAKMELKRTLASVEPDVMGNVIFFASEYFAASKELVPVQKSLARLEQHIDKQEIPTKPHAGRGNLFDPIIEACGQEEVDTLYLVTEGNPTEGRFIDRDRFVRHMMRTVKYTKTEIHSLFIGSAKSARRYLEAVSEPTGGRFYDVGEMAGHGKSK